MTSENVSSLFSDWILKEYTAALCFGSSRLIRHAHVFLGYLTECQKVGISPCLCVGLLNMLSHRG